jgi:hypothetical protein
MVIQAKVQNEEDAYSSNSDANSLQLEPTGESQNLEWSSKNESENSPEAFEFLF